MSDASVVPGTSPVPPEGSLQEQINNLKAQGVALTFQADIPTSFITPEVGMGVCPSAAEPRVGITSVGLANAVSSRSNAQCMGIIAAITDARINNTPTKVYTIQVTGKLVLTEAEWDARTSGSGGLAPGETYYLDAGGSLAQLPPGSPGQFSSQVGLALDATTMLLSCPSVPLENA